MAFELPPLPFEKDALEPHISKETLEYHHGKHHNAYVTKLNDLIKGTDDEGKSLEEIIQSAKGGLFNQAAQVWNHTFYWNSLSPNGGGEPSGALGEAITKKFGSFDKFKEEFNAKAAGNFGSGWTWLVKTSDGGVDIVNTDDADTPIAHGNGAWTSSTPTTPTPRSPTATARRRCSPWTCGSTPITSTTAMPVPSIWNPSGT